MAFVCEMKVQSLKKLRLGLPEDAIIADALACSILEVKWLDESEVGR